LKFSIASPSDDQTEIVNRSLGNLLRILIGEHIGS